jgi:hypothetical protein
MEHTLKQLTFVLMGLTLLLLSACGGQESACPLPTGTPQTLDIPPEMLPTPTPGTASAPIPVEIGGRTIPVDRVVTGPLCNDSWSGTVYVGCDVQVYPWTEQPTFLKDCALDIAPGTVVYVAYHNDTAYYNGCSCHTGEIAEP